MRALPRAIRITPVKGTALESAPPPDVSSYRAFNLRRTTSEKEETPAELNS
jgi:hypothetical protein